VIVPGARHEAALACGPLTRGVHRRSADPSEVIMSRGPGSNDYSKHK
jgi:hypothetical protein